MCVKALPPATAVNNVASKSGTWWATYRTFFRECPVSIWQTEDAINGTFRKVIPALHGEVYDDLSHRQLVF